MLRVGVLQGAGDERTEVVSRALVLLDKVQQWVLFSVHIMDKIKQLRLLVRRQILRGWGSCQPLGSKAVVQGGSSVTNLMLPCRMTSACPVFREASCAGVMSEQESCSTRSSDTRSPQTCSFFPEYEVVGAVHHREVGIGADGLRFGLAVNGLQLLEALQYDESADIPGAPGCHHAAQR